ncbi:MAG: dTDP-4-dehydrorhamnose reductase [Calditrichaeota bacterium]|nr:dTDP-4-dehydrorhamnose reductase [Calditrichota bacterium]
MKILITGANGLLGQKLLRTLSADYYDIFGVDLHPEPFCPDVDFTYAALDLTDRRKTLERIAAWQPAVIVHTAAMTDVDGCESRREDCWRINVSATETIAKTAKSCSAHLIYISTDYVFDGKSGPYDETAVPNPLGFYGKSKLAGENVVRGAEIDWVILRTIVLYGTGRRVKSSFITWLLAQLRSGKPVKIVNDQWGNTTIVDDLASAIDRVIMLQKTGLFNVAGRTFQTRYDMALTAAQIFDLDASLISPISTSEFKQPAPRPLRSGLIVTKAERELYLTFRSTEQALELYREQEKAATI